MAIENRVTYPLDEAVDFVVVGSGSAGGVLLPWATGALGEAAGIAWAVAALGLASGLVMVGARR